MSSRRRAAPGGTKTIAQPVAPAREASRVARAPAGAQLQLGLLTAGPAPTAPVKAAVRPKVVASPKVQAAPVARPEARPQATSRASKAGSGSGVSQPRASTRPANTDGKPAAVKPAAVAPAAAKPAVAKRARGTPSAAAPSASTRKATTAATRATAPKAAAKPARTPAAAASAPAARRAVTPKTPVTPKAPVTRAAPERAATKRVASKRAATKRPAFARPAAKRPVAGRAGKAPVAAPAKGTRAARVAAAPARFVKIKALDPVARCGPGTSVEHLFRVDESVDGRATVHLVFFDQYGWYCVHGRGCGAVADVHQEFRAQRQAVPRLATTTRAAGR